MRVIHLSVAIAVLVAPCLSQSRQSDAANVLQKNWEFGGLTLGLNSLEDAGLGLEYAYAKRWGKPDAVDGVDFGININGLIASEQKRNSANYQTAKLDLSWFKVMGGTTRAATMNSEFDSASVAERGVIKERLDTLPGLIAAEGDPKKHAVLVKESRGLEAVMGLSEGYYHWNLGLNAGIESNQAATLKNYTFGLNASLDAQWENDSAFVDWNVLDYPAALVRRVTGMDEKWRPRGYGPTFLVAVDQVDPRGSGPRAGAGDSSDFMRLSAEVAFKTPFFQFREETYYLDTSYRYFDEFDPAASVRSADLDAFDYWAVGIVSDSGWFLTYRSGQLPFDAGTSEAFELGFKTYF